MRKGIIVLLLGAFGWGTPTLEAKTIIQMADSALDVYSVDLTQETLADATQPTGLPGGPRLVQIYEFETKSPRRAFLYSLVVPGLGQLYAGSKIKAALFFAADVAAWGGYLTFRSRGNDKEDEFRAFADKYWDMAPYWNYLASIGYDRWHDRDTFPHGLPYNVVGLDTQLVKNLTYYENIGKYQQFIWGWDDTVQISTGAINPENNYGSPHRDQYVIKREDANKQFDRATAAAIVSIANHLISAFDAALTVRRFNRSTERAQKLDIDVRMVNLDDTPTPWLSLAYRF